MDFNQEHNDMSIEQNKLSKESEQAAPVPCVSDESAVPTVPAEKEQIAPAEPKSTTPMPSAVKAAAPTVSQSPEEKRKKHRLKTKKYWKKRRRRRARHRRFRRFLFFMLAFILGIVVAYGAVAGAVYFVVGGLTIDTLQKFGVAEGADQYLTENGDVDLTDTTLLDLVRDLQAVADRIESGGLIQRGGMGMPEVPADADVF